jgi:diguanylate cyclase (GGDEF)-like protein
VNDRHGHAAGDAVLRRAAALLQAQLRPEALLVRYGGEEFLALVPVEDLPVARRVAERMREAIAQAAWNDVAPSLGRVTASVGVTLLGVDEPLDVALERADQAQYRAKNGGRNQVQVGLSAA